MNLALAKMYNSGFWLPSAIGIALSKQLFFFLQAYHYLASAALQQGKRRFSLMPKLHYLCHAAVDLKNQSQNSAWCRNPLGTSVQVQEDFIGRPSRVSRRVDVRQVHKNTMNRCLLLAELALLKSDEDVRGLIWKV